MLYPYRFFTSIAAAMSLTGLACAHAGNTAFMGVSFTIDSACLVSRASLADKPEMPGVTCLHDEPVAVAKGTVASNLTPEAVAENASQSGEAAGEAGEPIWIVSF